jgi:hypothetical protein
MGMGDWCLRREETARREANANKGTRPPSYFPNKGTRPPSYFPRPPSYFPYCLHFSDTSPLCVPSNSRTRSSVIEPKSRPHDSPNSFS